MHVQRARDDFLAGARFAADEHRAVAARDLVNGLREAFELPGVPIRLIVKAGRNPYADKA